MFELSKEFEKIKKYKVISFDIFDTLVRRNIPNPTDIFDIVEMRFNRDHPLNIISGFKEKRVQAERKARELCPREEIIFQEIYDQLDLPIDYCNELKHLEEETELQFCQANYLLKQLYDECLAFGLTIVITSDMYLPQGLIVQILEKCGYVGYKRLYLSSDIGLKKSTGSLYDYLLLELHVRPREMIHIGDSKRSDNLIPLRKRIRTRLVERRSRNTQILSKADIYESHDPLFAFLNNSLPKYRSESNMFQWGYETFGPLLLAFTAWVHKKIRDNNIEESFFLARDMFLVYEIYQRLYGNKNIKYLEISRKSLRAEYVKKENRLDAVLDTMGRRNYTIGEVLQSLDIDVNAMNINVDISDTLFDNDMKSEKYRELSDIVFDVLHQRATFAEDYLFRMGMFEDKKAAIVDIGWHGTIQNMLEKLTGRPLTGLYFGNTIRASFAPMESYGFWFSFHDETKAKPYLTMKNILEVMLFKNIGTTTGYVKINGELKPQYAVGEQVNFKKIEQFQNGAKAFIDDYLYFDPGLWHLTSDNAVNSFRKMSLDPTLVQARTMSDLQYEDGKIFSLARLNSFSYYLTHPAALLKDYNGARWKEGFIKQVMPFIPKVHKMRRRTYRKN